MLLGTFLYKSLYGHMFSFLLGRSLGVESLHPMVNIMLNSLETAKMSSKLAPTFLAGLLSSYPATLSILLFAAAKAIYQSVPLLKILQ